MTVCEVCGSGLGATDAFCDSCGAPAPRRDNCGVCGHPIGPTTTFCGSCGSPVARAPTVTRPMPGEVRQGFDAQARVPTSAAPWPPARTGRWLKGIMAAVLALGVGATAAVFAPRLLSREHTVVKPSPIQHTRAVVEPSPSLTTTVTATASPTSSQTSVVKYRVAVHTCLRVRIAPSQKARQISCVAPNTILSGDDQTKSAEGYQWAHVQDPASAQWGWAAQCCSTDGGPYLVVEAGG